MNTVNTLLITDHPHQPNWFILKPWLCEQCGAGQSEHASIARVDRKAGPFAPLLVRPMPVVKVRPNRGAFPHLPPTHWKAECRVCGDVVLGNRWMCMTYGNRHAARHLGRHQ